MTDLKNGIINLDGLDIGPTTTLEEIAAHFPKTKITRLEELHVSSIRIIGLLKNEKGVFHSCKFKFKNNLLSGFEVSPHVDNYPEDSDRKEKQEVRRKLCNDWLYQWLGVPDYENKETNVYEFKWGRIIAYSQFRPSMEYTGGKIAASYSR